MIELVKVDPERNDCPQCYLKGDIIEDFLVENQDLQEIIIEIIKLASKSHSIKTNKKIVSISKKGLKKLKHKID